MLSTAPVSVGTAHKGVAVSPVTGAPTMLYTTNGTGVAVQPV